MIKDRNIDYRWRKKTIWAKEWANAVGAATAVLDTLDVGGTPVSATLNTSGVMGFSLDAAGEFVRHVMPINSDVDWDNDVWFRVLWSSGSSTPADTIDWKFLWKTVAINGALPPTVDETLGTTIAQDNVTAANELQVTAAGKIDGGTIDTSAQVIVIDAEMEAFAAGLSEVKLFLGVEMAYIPKFTDGPQIHDNADPF